MNEARLRKRPGFFLYGRGKRKGRDRALQPRTEMGIKFETLPAASVLEAVYLAEDIFVKHSALSPDADLGFFDLNELNQKTVA